MIFSAAVAVVAIVAASIAALSGFGIGSLLTPLFAMKMEARVAVGAVSIPHFCATALRMWTMRSHIDRSVFIRFGLLSAIGGLAGAVLQIYLKSPVLVLTLAILLLFSGVSGLINLKLNFGRVPAMIAGIFSGLLGGLVGNQGGIRSGALLGFGISKEALVATATAVGLIVDTARMPVYFWKRSGDIAAQWPVIVVAIVGVMLGTIVGGRILRRMPERIFKPVVSVLLCLLGVVLAVQSIRELAAV